ncbi:SWI/SNF-related matrix-associated actin-dependent regulator of chromatin subfamily D member 1-like isoform X2 [Ruditapes philippinarum]|uniref:SWI/SNF-related matrix-associated actin-dependent regulator of chromatin subfamily D member 1-like isoform X2 n=1 Tax=Ruditapes philippinarum TaxID=129788 RepID=UPI00295BB046|nr:SWI/SNF-related matrix-associated actin-dependent regulator of chromatin subfamily D member 1-like isoform X2 [Ruditapes philippinarum]
MKAKDPVWNHYDLIEGDDSIQKAKCKDCGSIVSAKSARLRIHRAKCCGQTPQSDGTFDSVGSPHHEPPPLPLPMMNRTYYDMMSPAASFPGPPRPGYSPGPGHPTAGPPMTGGMPPRMGMPHGPGMSPHPYGGMPRPGMGPGMPPPQMGMGTPMDRKRQSDSRAAQHMKAKKKKKMADKILPQRVRDLVPESQAYMDLLAFERKLDATITRKRLDIQEALKRPMKQKRKLRIFISNTFYPAKPAEGEEGEESVPSWELRVEGRLLEDAASAKLSDANKTKRKFSSFFKSLVIELDKELYGPDNHLVEWHRTQNTQETDGFQVKRPGDQNVRCTVLLMLDYQPAQFKLDPRLARLLGVHTQTRPVIINALWQYIKTHRLQDPHEREYINCDRYLEQIFECKRMKFAEIPGKLHSLLMPPDPIVINHVITVEGPDSRKTACYDIDVEVDDTLKQQMNSFLLSTQSQNEIANLDSKIYEIVETINRGVDLSLIVCEFCQ